MRNILEIKNVTKQFGGLTAVSNVSISIEEGTITAVIGPNGAGKTTFFNLITGFYELDEGDILLDGQSIKGLRPDQITTKGICRTFQNIRLFKEMTALENVMVAMDSKLKSGLFHILGNTKKVKEEELKVQVEAYRLLKYVGMEEFCNVRAGSLSYGTQRRLEIARALASQPKILLLDEPAAGMNPRETVELTDFIHQLRDELQLTIVLIEHDIKLVMELSDKIHVLEYGQKIAEGTPEEIRSNNRVIEAYLGKNDEAS